MGKTEKDLLEIIKESDTIIKNKEQMPAYEEALKQFKKLVEEGLIKKRGYNLQTIDEKEVAMSFSFQTTLHQ